MLTQIFFYYYFQVERLKVTAASQFTVNLNTNDELGRKHKHIIQVNITLFIWKFLQDW